MEPFLYPIITPYFAKRLQEPAQTRERFLDEFESLSERIKTILTAPATAQRLVAFGDASDIEYGAVEEIAFALREIATRTLALEKVPSFLVARGLQNDIAIAAAKEIENILGTPTGSAEQVTNNVVDLRNKSGV